MASGDTLVTWSPLANEPPSANYATPDTRNGHPVLDFDTTTAEYAIFRAVMPRHYSATTGITVYVHYACTSATTGTVGWTLEFDRVSDSQVDIDSDTWSSATTITAVTVPGTSGHVDICNAAVTNGANMDSIAVGEAFRMRLKRDVANDTATGDAELYMIEIKET